MPGILQGTTPTVTLEIYLSDGSALADLTDVATVQFIAAQADKYGQREILVSTLTDAVLDKANSQVSYQFTEKETMKLKADRSLLCQCRFLYDDGTIFGNAMVTYSVDELLDHAVYLGE